jgi:hypothetical protein
VLRDITYIPFLHIINYIYIYIVFWTKLHSQVKSDTKIFPCIFHTKPLIFPKKISWSHFSSNFLDFFTFKIRINKIYFKILYLQWITYRNKKKHSMIQLTFLLRLVSIGQVVSEKFEMQNIMDDIPQWRQSNDNIYQLDLWAKKLFYLKEKSFLASSKSMKPLDKESFKLLKY